jgi:predicted nucleotidyltransferase
MATKMTLEDYIDYFEIDIEATEAIDYLIELINEDLVFAVEEQDYEEAHRLQQIIEDYL